MLFIFCVIFSYCIKILVYFLLKRRKISANNNSGSEPKSFSVEIIIPMYNERKVILGTVRNVLCINHKNLLITIIDDGSNDGSLDLVRENFQEYSQVQILHQVNKGKSVALNYAIGNSTRDIIICIDADTLVKPNIVEKILPYFNEEKVAAVSGNIRVGNRKNLITNLQHLEYITNPNYERAVFEVLNGIMVVPGAIGAFRRSIVANIGGYTNDTLTEDSEITMKILCNDYIIRNAVDVIGYTEAPASLKTFFNQRIRWKVGTVQVLIKYRKKIFSIRNKALAQLVIPYTWIFGIILPLLIPMVDYIFFYHILILNETSVLLSYFLFILIDGLVCSTILLRNNEPKQIFHIILHRLFLRHLIQFTYFAIMLKFIKGGLFKWENSVRYGNNKID